MNFAAILPLTACIILETFQQLSYSLAGRIVHKRFQFITLGIVCYLSMLIIWFWVLTFIPLGVATPLMGASYVTVALASKILFKSHIDFVHWAGIVLIISGLALISIS